MNQEKKRGRKNPWGVDLHVSGGGRRAKLLFTCSKGQGLQNTGTSSKVGENGEETKRNDV